MKKATILEYIVDIILIITLSFIYYLNMVVHTNEVVYIPKGSINKIITHLQAKKYDVGKLDSLLLRFIGNPQSGWIFIGTKELRRGDFLYKLTHAKAPMVDITLIPGETTYVFMQEVAKKLGLSHAKLMNYFYQEAPYKEGVLVPDTYKIPYGIQEKTLVLLLLKKSQKEMKDFSMKVFGVFDERKWRRFVTIASIIQKEAANKEEMPIIASVIYNRLRKKMKLQMDGSLNYGKYSHTKITASRLRHDSSRYNTYLYRGLPPYPVCNPGFDAIKAAIFPKRTDYLYFVKGKDNKHLFSSTFQKHKKNVTLSNK